MSRAFLVAMVMLCMHQYLQAESLLPTDTMNFAARLPKAIDSSNTFHSNASELLTGPVVRIQLLTTTAFANARLASRVAQELFGEPVSVDFESPNFKVRLGRFQNSSDAQHTLERVRQAGFTNPILVTQKLMQRADSTVVPSATQTLIPDQKK